MLLRVPNRRYPFGVDLMGWSQALISAGCGLTPGAETKQTQVIRRDFQAMATTQGCEPPTNFNMLDRHDAAAILADQVMMERLGDASVDDGAGAHIRDRYLSGPRQPFERSVDGDQADRQMLFAHRRVDLLRRQVPAFGAQDLQDRCGS